MIEYIEYYSKIDVSALCAECVIEGTTIEWERLMVGVFMLIFKVIRTSKPPSQGGTGIYSQLLHSYSIDV